MSHDVGGLQTHCVEQSRYVAYRFAQRVLSDLSRSAGLPEAAHVWHNRAKAVSGQKRDLVAPHVRGVGPTVQEQHRSALFGFFYVERNSVDVNGPAFTRAHVSPPVR